MFFKTLSKTFKHLFHTFLKTLKNFETRLKNFEKYAPLVYALQKKSYQALLQTQFTLMQQHSERGLRSAQKNHVESLDASTLGMLAHQKRKPDSIELFFYRALPSITGTLRKKNVQLIHFPFAKEASAPEKPSCVG